MHRSAREYRIAVPACAAVHTLESPPSHPSCIGASLQRFRMDGAASDPHLTTGRKSSGGGGLMELSARRPLSREVPGRWEARRLSCCLFSDQPLGCVSIQHVFPELRPGCGSNWADTTLLSRNLEPGGLRLLPTPLIAGRPMSARGDRSGSAPRADPGSVPSWSSEQVRNRRALCPWG